MKLILFDIDGTLIQANGAGKQMLALAMEDVFGTAGPIEKYNLGGKTDTQIVTDLLRATAIPDHQIETNLPTLFARMVHHGQTVLPTSRAAPCPGVKPLLAALQGRPDMLLGLVTGNIEPVAPLKLAAAGLDPTIFRVGAYGSQHHDRNQLPPLAMKQATDLTKLQFAGYNTIVVGDTPLDIQCARANGAKAVAVATGRYTLTTLNQYKPDILLPNLADTETVLQLLLA
ncbi:MAG: HAD hydrolase-like protein [Anaerolineae bacterium]|nr:HAD hydrolase-like protein [Anaerolineae bacterium]